MRYFSATIVCFAICSFAHAQQLKILDLKSPTVAQQVTPTSDQIKITPPSADLGYGLSVTLPAGDEPWPGVTITSPDGKPFNLAKFGYIQAKVHNTGATPLLLSMRLDNDGDWKKNPWNAESDSVGPQQTKTLTVCFGRSYGQPGYPLDASAITQVKLFTDKRSDVGSFRIDSLIAGGTPGSLPPAAKEEQRHRPKDDTILGGQSSEALSVTASDADAAATPGSIKVTVPGNKPGKVAIRPAEGLWDLSESLEVKIKIHGNDGTAHLRARVGSKAGFTADTAIVAIGSNADTEIIVPFQTHIVLAGEREKTSEGKLLASDAVNAIELLNDAADSPATFTITSITADVPPPPNMPEWLGKRPPVEGDWVQTLDENFDEPAINDKVWNVAGDNWYDKVSHWSKDDLLLGDGMLRVRYEKKTGRQNDSPTGKETPYAAGFMDSYGKWVQRYGYFEARMKLPTAPGLWPAFWMMPDRGTSFIPRAGRGETGNGGMEFDVMEYLSRWGPYRYNIAMHWDGYKEAHKVAACEHNYVRPDADGFITCGLLWLPGQAIYYCNGVELLRWDSPRISNVPSDLMLTLPSGGWDNNALDDAKLPADWTIDYIRCWQRRDLSSAADTTPVRQITH